MQGCPGSAPIRRSRGPIPSNPVQGSRFGRRPRECRVHHRRDQDSQDATAHRARDRASGSRWRLVALFCQQETGGCFFLARWTRWPTTDAKRRLQELHLYSRGIGASSLRRLAFRSILELPEVEEEKRPREVAQQVLRATYKVLNLQTALGMDASGVPSLTLVRVTPSEVFDSTNMLLAEMARIKFHLGVDERRPSSPEPTGKRPRDSFALVLANIKNLDRISAVARS